MSQLKKTYSSWTDDKNVKGVPKVNPERDTQIRRDTDKVKTPSITLESVDTSILEYLRDEVRLSIDDNSKSLPVSIEYASQERWANIQAFGYLRDEHNKRMAPLVIIRRNSLAERSRLKKLDVNQAVDGNVMLYQPGFTKENRYNSFTLANGLQKSKEIYAVNIPEFVDIEYELFIWTDFQTQMNSIIEQLMPTGGFAWGSQYKFITYLNSYSFDTVTGPGEDRLVRATIGMTVKGTLLMEHELHKDTIQKKFSPKKVDFNPGV